MDEMTQENNAGLQARALALRREGLSRRQIRNRLKIRDNRLLTHLLEGEPPPQWTKRANAKDDLRAMARQLRSAGKTYNEIVAELGVAKSSVSLWVRDLPKQPASPERLHRMREAPWGPYREARDARRRETKRVAESEIGHMTERELFLLGVGLYWAEGAKSKPYQVREDVQFVNSDPGMIRVYLAWLAMLGVEPDRIQFRVMVHERADVEGAEHYWADLVGVDVAVLDRTTLKKHNPKTVRKNVEEGYRGCLMIRVRRGADLYRRIEGWWCGIVGAANSAT